MRLEPLVATNCPPVTQIDPFEASVLTARVMGLLPDRKTLVLPAMMYAPSVLAPTPICKSRTSTVPFEAMSCPVPPAALPRIRSPLGTDN